MFIPERVTVINNCRTRTRFIFKIGYGVESSQDWHEVEEAQNLDGTLFDTELMEEILSEEEMYHIHDFMDLLENLKDGKPINKYSFEDNKISRKLYTEICELLTNIKNRDYDSIFTLDEKFISDEDSPEE